MIEENSPERSRVADSTKSKIIKAGVAALEIGSLILASCGPAKATEKVTPTGESVDPAKTLTVEPLVQTEVFTQTPTETATPESIETALSTEAEHITTPDILLIGDSMFALTKIPTMLEAKLKAAGYQVEFVGDKYSYGNTTPADGLGGFNSLTMWRQLTGEDPEWNKSHDANTWYELKGTTEEKHFLEHIPDIVILDLGSNDALNLAAGGYDTPENYLEHMTAIIRYLQSKNPNVMVVMSKLNPGFDAKYNANVPIFNKVIDQLVVSTPTETSKVVTTRDLGSDWKSEDLRDIVHPSDSGQEKKTQAVFDALVDNGLAPIHPLP